MGIRNRIGWQQWLGRLQGSAIDLNLLSYDDPLRAIGAHEAGPLATLSPKRRQELLLAASAVALAGLATGGVVLARRLLRR